MSDMKFLVNGEEYELDFEKLTFAEARAFETHSGIVFTDTFDNPSLRAGVNAMQAIVWIAVKRKKPETKFSDLDDVEIGSIVADDEDEEPDQGEVEADPTPAADELEQPRHAAIAAVS